jgi:hypothetical protein
MGSHRSSRVSAGLRQAYLRMITAYDYGIIAFYLVFMVAIGLVFPTHESEHLGLLPRGRSDAVVADGRVGLDL